MKSLIRKRRGQNCKSLYNFVFFCFLIWKSENDFTENNYYSIYFFWRFRSKVWKFFTRDKQDSYAVCKICSKKYRLSGNAYNLAEHLNRKRKEAFTASTSSESNSDLDKTEKTEKQNEKEKPSLKREKQESIHAILKRKICFKPNNPKKQKYDKQLTKMIVAPYLSFSLVDAPEFITFTNMLNPWYVVPSRKILSTELMSRLYNEVKMKLMNIPKDVEYVSLTSDCWTLLAVESYCTVTCHFIQDNQSTTVVLNSL